MQTSSISEDEVKRLSQEVEAAGVGRYCKGWVDESGCGVGIRRRVEVGSVIILKEGSSEECVAALYGGGLMIVGRRELC